MMVPIVITAIVTLLIAVPVTALIASAQCKKGIEQKIGNADDKAREIIDEALRTPRAAEGREHRQEDRCDREERSLSGEAGRGDAEAEGRDFPIERAACPGTGKNLWFDLRPGKGIFAENC